MYFCLSCKKIVQSFIVNHRHMIKNEIVGNVKPAIFCVDASQSWMKIMLTFLD